MRRVFLFCCLILLTLSLLGTSPAFAFPAASMGNRAIAPDQPKTIAPSILTLPGLGHLFAGTTPLLGLEASQLQPCPETPNCVVSQDGDAEHGIEPIAYQGDRTRAHDTLLQVLKMVPGSEVVEQREDYIRAEFTSKLMGFVDDGEFYFPSQPGVIQVRSAARLGESDLGVNRRRLEQIRLAMADLNA